MDARDLIESAWHSLGRTRLRSALSMLGVAIGTGAVILLVSMGLGAKYFLEGEFAALGTNMLVVKEGKTETGGTEMMVLDTTHHLTIEDVAALRRHMHSAQAVSNAVVGGALVRHGALSKQIFVGGVDVAYEQVRRTGVVSGRFIRQGDIDARRNVCLIGQRVIDDLFPVGRSPLGERLHLGDRGFLVVGVLEAKGEHLGIDFDDLVLIPDTTALDLLKTPKVTEVYVQARSADHLEDCRAEITEILKQRHGGRVDFTIISQDQALEVMGKILGVVTAMLAGIAGISLLVGGIGIMNIMLAGVRERTREIGVRKALGARRRDIVRQFLVEAGVLSGIGGALGVLVGLGGGSVLSALAGDHFPMAISWWVVAPALGFSVAVGVIFGLHPARLASRLSVLESLRYE